MSNKKIIQKIVVGAVIEKDNKVLILQRHNDEDIFPGMWELPSGKREHLELSASSLIREVKEETGLTVKIIAPVSVFDYQIEEKNKIADSTQINFLVRPLGRKMKVNLSKEHQNFHWININEIEKYKLSKATKDVIRKAFSLLEQI